MEKTIEILLEENKKRPLKAMNILLEKVAVEQGLSLEIESNFYECEDEKDLVQGISIGKELEQTLQSLGATMNPSLQELEKKVNEYQGEEPFEDTVEIVTKENAYIVPVFMGILNRTLSLWVDMNELKPKLAVAI
ncbi:hypothetical protein CVD28_00380 [Bacillus sp. M6-12]|uniref:hypothetical protein n=1 Tax=Bacillus sp. M6-12 TaxID=2054166 RepID=UPI000C7879B7|nr:hypothetical protein [Bacillus sp. M6-12]PLS18891.1 hypothetical protein CVD28_00380 [Bacillus sp. M6-12]